MKIRSITMFQNWEARHSARLREIGSQLRQLKEHFEAGGYEVQTVRLAFPSPGNLAQPDDLPKAAREIEEAATDSGVEYVSLGAVESDDSAAMWDAIPRTLEGTKTTFVAGKLTSSQPQASGPAIESAARVILANSSLEPDGFANLRFAALAKVQPGVPFFPAAFSDATGGHWAIATESADLVVSSFAGQSDSVTALEKTGALIRQHTTQLQQLADTAGLPATFSGIDFSFAPFPEPSSSLGTVLVRAAGGGLSTPGSLAVAAALTSLLDRLPFARTGFCGLFLPVLEDAALALASANGRLTLNDLLLYSSVCGTGLDTVPLPGDTSESAIASILSDVAALATRLDKPLTARLMPIPAKSPGDKLTFDFPYFADGAVLGLGDGIGERSLP